jgi:diguanylate cyclase
MSSPTPSPAQAPATRRMWWLRRWLGTLKFRVVLVAMAAALVSGGVATLYLSHQNQQATGRLFAQQQADGVELMADMLNGRVEHLSTLLKGLGADLNVGMMSNPAALEAVLMSRPSSRAPFESVWVAALDGTALVALDRSGPSVVPDDLAAQAFFKRAVEAHAPVVSGGQWQRQPYESPVMLTFTQPLSDMHGPYGVIGATVLLQSSHLLSTSFTALGQFYTGVMLVDSEDQLIAAADVKRLLKSASQEPGLGPVFDEWKANGRTNGPEALGRVGGGYIVAMAGVPSARWLLARATPTDYALGLLARAERQTFAIVGLIMGLSALLVGLLVAWMVQPLTVLRNRAEVLLAGDAEGDHAWPRASGEIGDLVRVFQRVTRDRAAHRRSEKRLLGEMQAILDHASVGIVVVRQGRFELISAHMAKLLGYSPATLVGKRVAWLGTRGRTGSEQRIPIEEIRSSLQQHGRYEGEANLARADGTLFWAHLVGRSLDANDVAQGQIWIVSDITADREARNQLSWSATHDSLTELVNRREFEARLSDALSARTGSEVALMFVDLDHFKPINDTASHAAGDEALRQIARALSAQVRSADTVARLGGDEFAVLLPGCSLDRASALAERICGAVRGLQLHFGGRQFRVTASVGVVVGNDTFATANAMLHAADMACYRAKAGGRDQVQLAGRIAEPTDNVVPLHRTGTHRS